MVCLASCSSFCLAARTAFSASPGLRRGEVNFGSNRLRGTREPPLLWLAGLERDEMGADLSAHLSSSELEWVLHWARPSSHMSRSADS